MNLNKDALDLSYKILANVKVKDYNAHISDVKHAILTALVSCYIKARNDQLHGKPYDLATCQNSIAKEYKERSERLTNA